MRMLRWCALVAAVGVFATACAEDPGIVGVDRPRPTGDQGVIQPEFDVPNPLPGEDVPNGTIDVPNRVGGDTGVIVVDGGGIYDDVPGAPSDARCAGDGGVIRPPGCVGAEVCNNGLDDNCNGQADENCTCIPGSVQRCFLGPPGRRGVGACVDGMQTCQGAGEFGNWGPCAGGISPRPEICDNLDNNCDGRADDDLCCRPDGTCPGPGDPRIPTGGPFRDYTLRGADFLRGAMTYRWRVIGGPCDQLLFATSQQVTYTLNMGPTTQREVTSPNLIFRPTLSGDYTVTLTITRADGTTLECTFIIPIRAPGFRAELCWNTTGSDDVDFWVHRPRNTNPWVSGGTNTGDNCAYNNCRNNGLRSINWGYAATPGMDCREPAAGGCNNPRLDIDNIATRGVPENINVDNPNAGDDFRVAVNYYGGANHDVQPMVNIYCGGALRATYGGADAAGMHFGSAPITGFNRSGANSTGSLWRVADVVMMNANDCTLHALHPAGMAAGYCVATNSDRTYNGTCSR